MAKASCKNCFLANLCFPLLLNSSQLEALDKKIKRRKLIKRGETLFSHHDKFTQLYVVRSGAFKALSPHKDQQQICNFYLPGEIIGFDSVASQQHQTTTIALTDSFVCAISYSDLAQFAAQHPVIQQQLVERMSQEITLYEQACYHGEAADRLLHFLRQMAERYRRRGLSATEFELPMSKQDIANYLGMASETISRLFSKLQAQGVLTINKRLIRFN